MRIGIDARFVTLPQPGGFKTYSQNLITALAQVDTENEYILYVDRPPEATTNLPRQPNITVRVVSGRLPLVGMPWREQIGVAARAYRDHLDLLHAPCLTAPLCLSCPLVVTIHDMIWHFIETFARGNRRSFQRRLLQWYNRLIPRIMAHRAAAILTVSHAARASIIEHMHLPAERVVVTYPAASPIYRPTNTAHAQVEVRRQFGIATDFILAIGSADPRKNLSALLQAYALLPPALQARYELVIVWTHPLLIDTCTRQAETLRIGHRLRPITRISDAQLALLYNAAALFVFPSRYEGFGLPPLEAMSCGLPVVAADNSSIPEIVGEAALLTAAEDIPGLARQIRRGLTDTGLRAELRERGLRRAADFSWQRCARQTVAVYKTAVGRS